MTLKEFRKLWEEGKGAFYTNDDYRFDGFYIDGYYQSFYYPRSADTETLIKVYHKAYVKFLKDKPIWRFAPRWHIHIFNLKGEYETR